MTRIGHEASNLLFTLATCGERPVNMAEHRIHGRAHLPHLGSRIGVFGRDALRYGATAGRQGQLGNAGGRVGNALKRPQLPANQEATGNNGRTDATNGDNQNDHDESGSGRIHLLEGKTDNESLCSRRR